MDAPAGPDPLQPVNAALERKDFARARALCEPILEREPRNARALRCAGLARKGLGDLEGAADALARAAALERRDARLQHDLANVYLDQKKTDRAISCFRRALRMDDSLAEVHNDLGTAYYAKGWHAEAAECFRAAIERKPDHEVAHANLGAALRAQGKLNEGRRAFQRALALKVRAMLPPFLRWKVQTRAKLRPRDPLEAGLAQEAGRLRRLLVEGKIPQALAEARALAERAPESAEAMNLLGMALGEAGESDAAIDRLKLAVERRPDVTDYWISLAKAYSKLGRLDEAVASAEAALRLEPGSAVVFAAVAALFHPWNEERAEFYARRALELDPGLDAAHSNLAAALWGQGRLAEAEPHCREALRLNPKMLNNVLNLALILKDQGRIAEARELYRSVEPSSADNAKLCTDLGSLVVECGGDFEEARRWFRRAQALSADARPHLSEAILDLLQGNYAAGWDRYDARKRTFDQRIHHRHFKFPEWNGEPLAGEHLLVYGEQGLGDEMMFASMLPDVLTRARRVTLLCEARFGALFARSFPGIEVIGEAHERQAARVAQLRGIDFQAGAGSLGKWFRRRLEDFPRHGGYLRPDPAKVGRWQERLADLGEGLRIGLSWQGGLQRTGRSRRSLALEAFAPLLERPGARWVSLQHAPLEGEVARYSAETGIGIAEHEGITRDLDELAALIAALDLVISVCNTTVHLSGAIGKEVWVLAPLVPDWRYGLRAETMAWYPSARVFRQALYGEWRPVIAAVEARLAARLAA